MKEILSIYGLGKLGCTMLACFAHKGWQVIGVDIIESSVERINRGECPIYEPGVAEFIKNSRSRIRATTDLVQAALDSDISFIIVPTPSKQDGSFSTAYVENAIKGIGEAIRQKKSYHLVIVTSTVMPGDTERMKGLLEEISGKKCGEDFGVCYNPDFIALGKIIHDFLNPDMLLIGESDNKAGDLIESIHSRLVNNHPEYHRMSFHNAELSKIGLNAYCTLKITYANIIGEICENMPTGDADDVLDAIGADSRVGKKYFRAGLGYSGTCFPRDGRAFRHSAENYHVINTLAGLNDTINNYQKKERIPRILQDLLRSTESKTISILGITFKEDVTIIEESPALDAAEQLAQRGYQVQIYDPAGMDAAIVALEDYPNVVFFKTIKECLRGSSVCFIGTPWNDFRALTEMDFLDSMNDHPVIFDAWSLYQNKSISSSDKICYRRIGENPEYGKK